MDSVKPYDSNILMKPVHSVNDPDEAGLDEDHTSDNDSNGVQPIHITSQRKIQESSKDNGNAIINDIENILEVATNGPEAQEIKR